MKSLETGYAELDRLTGGLKAGEVFLLRGAKPDLALNICRNLSRQRKWVLYFSLQESGEQIAQRLLSQESGVPLEKIQDRTGISPAEAGKLTVATLECKQWNMLVDDSPELAISELIRKARRIQEYLESGKAENPVAIMMRRPRLPKGEKLDLIVIDHIQRVKAGDAGFPGVILELKKLAEELGIPVLVLAKADEMLTLLEDGADQSISFLARDEETAGLTVIKSGRGEGWTALHFVAITPRVSAGKQ